MGEVKGVKLGVRKTWMWTPSPPCDSLGHVTQIFEASASVKWGVENSFCVSVLGLPAEVPPTGWLKRWELLASQSSRRDPEIEVWTGAL